MPYDYRKLEGKIVEKCKTKGAFAKAVGISPSSLSKKLKGIVDFSQTEMIRTCEIFDEPLTAIPAYFFAR